MIFFEFKDIDGKRKIEEIPKKVLKLEHKYEVKAILGTKSGSHLVTMGTQNDTSVFVYELETLKLIGSLNINELKNIDMKLDFESNNLYISTAMYEIPLVKFNRKLKYNAATGKDDELITVEKSGSVRGIKKPLSDFAFSWDNKFLVVGTESDEIKLFLNNAPSFTFCASMSTGKTLANHAHRVAVFSQQLHREKFNTRVVATSGNKLCLFGTDHKILLVVEKLTEFEIENVMFVDEVTIVAVTKCGKIQYFDISKWVREN